MGSPMHVGKQTQRLNESQVTQLGAIGWACTLNLEPLTLDRWDPTQ